MSSLRDGELPAGVTKESLENWVWSLLSQFPIPTRAELGASNPNDDPLVALFKASNALWACTLLNVLDPSVCCSESDSSDDDDDDEPDGEDELENNMRRFAEGVRLIGVANDEAFSIQDLRQSNSAPVITTVYVLKTLVSYTNRLSDDDDNDNNSDPNPTTTTTTTTPTTPTTTPTTTTTTTTTPSSTTPPTSTHPPLGPGTPGGAAGRIIRQHQTLSSSLRNSAALKSSGLEELSNEDETDDDDESDLDLDDDANNPPASSSSPISPSPSSPATSASSTSGPAPPSSGASDNTSGETRTSPATSLSSVYQKPMTLEERRKARDAEAEILVEEGFMTKRGGSRKNWQKRFFVLTTKKLTYAGNRNKPIKGTIDANDMIAVHDEHDPAEIKKRKNCFCLVTSHRRYYMSCSSDAYKDVWMEALRSVINFTPTIAPSELAESTGVDGDESLDAMGASGGPRSREASRTGTIMILPETTLRSGFLTKKGGGSSNWSKRWFVLTNWKLTYSAKPSKPVKGTIQVANIRSVGVANPDNCSKSNALAIETPTRTFEAFAGSEMERNEWIEDIESTMLARARHALLSTSRMLLRVIVYYACQPMHALLSIDLNARMVSIKHAIFACLGLDSSLLMHYVLLDDHLVPVELSAATLAATSLFDGKVLYLRPKPGVFISFQAASDVASGGGGGGGEGSSAGVHGRGSRSSSISSGPGGSGSGSGGILALDRTKASRDERKERRLSSAMDRTAVMAAISVAVHNRGTGAGVPYAAPEVRLSPVAVAEICREGRVNEDSFAAIAGNAEYWTALMQDGEALPTMATPSGTTSKGESDVPIVVGGALDDLSWTAELSTRVEVRQPLPGAGASTTTGGKTKLITQGYVKKRAGTGPLGSKGKKSWQRRWLMLTETCLLYSKGPDTAVKGAIDLERVSRVTSYVPAPPEVAENVFSIITPARTYYMSCSTEEDMMQWVAAINAMLSADPLSAAAANPEVLLEGPLRKRGEGETSSLNSRWCILTDASMSYATRKGNPARGKISISHIMRVEVSDEDELEFHVVTPERTYYFFASNQLDHSKWVSTLQSICTVPPYPSDPFNCWLIWRRAYEAGDVATFCAYKESPGTSYIGGFPFSVARDRSVPSLAEIQTPPVSQFVAKDVLATLTFNDLRTKVGEEYLSGKVHLRKREDGDGWLVASEDWSHVLNFLKAMA